AAYDALAMELGRSSRAASGMLAKKRPPAGALTVQCFQSARGFLRSLDQCAHELMAKNRLNRAIVLRANGYEVRQGNIHTFRGSAGRKRLCGHGTKRPLPRHANCELLLDRRQALVGLRKTFLVISYRARQSADGRQCHSQRSFMLAPAFATGAELLLHSVERCPGLNA